MANAPSPHHVSTSAIAAGADQASDADGSFGTVFRKAAADVLGAMGFGGIIGGFSAFATYLTTQLAPQWFAGAAGGIASPEGLLLTAAVAGAIGVVSMVTSTVIKNHIEVEQHAREAVKHQQPQVVVVPVQAVSQTVQHHHQTEQQVNEGKFVAMLEKQKEEQAKGNHLG